MTNKRPTDHAQRRQALDPGQSYIVQAPAGSGKTGLLTQRFLKLLTTAESPEEIVAITFTRKAAAEMRSRVLQALAEATDKEPDDAYVRQTWLLAREALAHAESGGWNLLDNPQRLRIRTIDSLCQYIARQMPLRSGFGDAPGPIENAMPLYREAALSVLGELESGTALAGALTTLLTELDNNLDGLQTLIADMLGKRDQWLRHIVSPDSRQKIEGVLQQVVETHLARLQKPLYGSVAEQLPPLARYAADNVTPDHVLAACRDLPRIPDADIASLPAWQALADLLLTAGGKWRKSVDVRNGFPRGDGKAGEMKAAMSDLLERLRPDIELEDLLHGLRKLPQPAYPDEDWVLIQALFTVLRAAVAHLKVVFSEHGKVDFCETALAAQEALGAHDNPTDLALRLDYQIRHLLVDEFQDTSQNQYQLFQQLTAGWQPGDGRTLFLVGDPMQSIYGFREAEVGLFLDAWQGRLGDVELKPLRLSVNFRSDRGIIDWVNLHFPNVLPPVSDKVTGAVSYAASEAYHTAGTEPAVNVHPSIGRDDAEEARDVVDIIQRVKEAEPAGTTAVLVRSKSHLKAITLLLRERRIRFQAVEIGELRDRPVVMDLLSLTLSLLHLADRVSWLALLHSPLCGLELADLHALTGDDRGDYSRAIIDLLHDNSHFGRLSQDGRERAHKLLSILDRTFMERGRRSFRDWIEGAWFALGGPVGLHDEAALDDVEVYFQMLQNIEDSVQLMTPEVIREDVHKLFSQPDPLADECLQLMTIHKAKGLEFDNVIIPGLGRVPRIENRKLLYWLETTDDNGRPELFFGPVKSRRGGSESPTSAYIRDLESRISQLESGRLIYVAATRARKMLHLFGHANAKKGREILPAGNSLLAQLWPALGSQWAELTDAERESETAGEEQGGYIANPPQFRIPTGWISPDPPENAVGAIHAESEFNQAIKFEWAGATARAVGTVVHRFLQHLVETGGMRPESLAALEPPARTLLLREGVLEKELNQALDRVKSALKNALEDDRGRWVLSPRHDDSRCEVSITAKIDGQLRHMIIDRTFIDKEGTRWIIDYKTGTHEGGDIDGFLDEEQDRYSAQMEGYAKAFSKIEDREIRTALYYPLIKGGWRELDFGE